MLVGPGSPERSAGVPGPCVVCLGSIAEGLMAGGGDVRVTRVDQGPCTFAPEPALPIRKLLNVARIEASPHCRRTLSPRIGEESLQHAAERAVAGGDLDHFAYPTRAQVIEV